MLSGYRSLLFVFILSINSLGQIFTEEFNYQLGKSFSTGRWSLTGTSPWIVEGDLNYNSYPSLLNNKKLMMSDNLQGTIISSLLSTYTENSIYCSFLLQLFSLDNLTIQENYDVRDDFFSFLSGSLGRKFISIRKAGDGYKIGISNKDNLAPEFCNQILSINTTYLIVIAYSFESGSETGKLWINPNLDSSEPVADKIIYGSIVGSISKIQFLQNSYTGDMYIDAIRVATTWSESALPVELEAFNAEVVNNCVVLNWRTATEVNNYGFEIERSYDRSNWECIKFVNGNGNSNRVIHYTYTDDKVSGDQIVYYRLKQIDTDGTYTYSEVAEVKTGNMSYELSQNYPNPFNPETLIKYSVAEKGFVNIKIYDMTGKEVMQLVNDLQDSGEYSVKFNAAGLATGMYMYRISVNGFVETRKMLLLN